MSLIQRQRQLGDVLIEVRRIALTAPWQRKHSRRRHGVLRLRATRQPDPDEVLNNLTFYWLTNTGISSTRLYWENTFDFFGVKGVTIPAAVSVFPKESTRPRAAGRAAYSNLIYFNEVDGAATSPPGRSRCYSPLSYARRSGRCGRPLFGRLRAPGLAGLEWLKSGPLGPGAEPGQRSPHGPRSPVPLVDSLLAPFRANRAIIRGTS